MYGSPDWWVKRETEERQNGRTQKMQQREKREERRGVIIIIERKEKRIRTRIDDRKDGVLLSLIVYDISSNPV